MEYPAPLLSVLNLEPEMERVLSVVAPAEAGVESLALLEQGQALRISSPGFPLSGNDE
jgi:hypothetical protein